MTDKLKKREEALAKAGREAVIDQTTGKFKAPGESDKSKKPKVEQPPGTVMDQNNPFKDEGEAEEYVPPEQQEAAAEKEEDGYDDMTVAQLQAEAKKRDIDTKGLTTKKQLVDALRAA